MCNLIYTFVNAVKNNIMFQLYLWHEFYNIAFKIKNKLYIASRSASLPPPPRSSFPNEKFYVRALCYSVHFTVSSLYYRKGEEGLFIIMQKDRATVFKGDAMKVKLRLKGPNYCDCCPLSLWVCGMLLTLFAVLWRARVYTWSWWCLKWSGDQKIISKSKWRVKTVSNNWVVFMFLFKFNAQHVSAKVHKATIRQD
jgi:hypothetical protein